MLSWGANSYGQLGSGDTEDRSLPVEVSVTRALGPDEIKTIVGGGGHTCVLTDEGTVFSCGHNDQGQLGLGFKGEDVPELTNIKDLYQLTEIACGWDFTLATTADGAVYGWGSNKYGQLGNEDIIQATKPEIIDIPGPGQKCVGVAAGLRHSMFLTDRGRVFVSGANKKQQLGLGEDFDKVKKVEELTEVNVKGCKGKVVKVAAGAYHSAVITEDGLLYMWGDNKFGQLSLVTLPYQQTVDQPDHLTSPSLVSPELLDGRWVRKMLAGWCHTVIQTEDGHVYSWGRSDYGQLGRDVSQTLVSGVEGGRAAIAPHPSSCAVPGEIVSLKGAKHLSCGAEHNLAITSSGQLVSWGWNEHGMCGTGDEVNVFTPTEPQLPKHPTGSRPRGLACGAGCSFTFC